MHEKQNSNTSLSILIFDPSQWAQDVHRTSPGRLLVPVYFRRPEDIKMGPDLDFILRDVLRTSLERPIKNFNGKVASYLYYFNYS